MAIDLVQAIRDNPGAVAVIDNDCWWLYKVDPSLVDYDDENLIAQDGEVIPLGKGYGSGCLYGGDLLQALAVIVGIEIRSV